MASKSNEADFHKRFLVEAAKKVSKAEIEEAAKKATKDHLLSEKLSRGRLKVVLLADNKESGVPLELIVDLQEKIGKLGFSLHSWKFLL